MQTEIKTIIVELICPKCELGDMERKEENVLLSFPPQYKYVCNNCRYEENIFETYPYFKYKKKDKTRKIIEE